MCCALDLPGIKGLLPPNFRKMPFFDKIYNLDTVPIATVQVRFDGWVTEMENEAAMLNIAGDQSDGRGAGIDNLLYSADAEVPPPHARSSSLGRFLPMP